MSSETGEDFYAPTVLGTNTALTAINDQDAVDALEAAGNKYCDYLKYNILVMSEKESDGGKDLKLNIKVTPTGANITKWYRVAVYGITPSDADSTARTAETPTIAALTGNKPANSDTWNAVYANSNYGEKPATGVSTYSESTVTRTALTSGEATITVASEFTSTEGPAFKDICVAVWMEGTAEDGIDQNTAGGEKVKVDFTFSV
ncbi:MAG: hypothetical protein IJS37_00685 [Bacilli bacterium]|nr:hypothetical protein [Bacilli bacterium]